MCLPVSLKVLIRRWTASQWGNTTMIRSQLWWHLRRNGKTQNISTPFCMITYIYPSNWCFAPPCLYPSTFMSQNHLIQHRLCVPWCCLCIFFNEKRVIVYNCTDNELPWWCNPCVLHHLQWCLLGTTGFSDLFCYFLQAHHVYLR